MATSVLRMVVHVGVSAAWLSLIVTSLRKLPDVSLQGASILRRRLDADSSSLGPPSSVPSAFVWQGGPVARHLVRRPSAMWQHPPWLLGRRLVLQERKRARSPEPRTWSPALQRAAASRGAWVHPAWGTLGSSVASAASSSSSSSAATSPPFRQHPVRPCVPVSHAVPHVHAPARPVAPESSAVPHSLLAVPPVASEPVPAPSLTSVPLASAGIPEWWTHSTMHKVLLQGGTAAVPPNESLAERLACAKSPRRRRGQRSSAASSEPVLARKDRVSPASVRSSRVPASTPSWWQQCLRSAQTLSSSSRACRACWLMRSCIGCTAARLPARRAPRAYNPTHGHV